jgi:hypothetical protein
LKGQVFWASHGFGVHLSIINYALRSLKSVSQLSEYFLRQFTESGVFGRFFGEAAWILKNDSSPGQLLMLANSGISNINRFLDMVFAGISKT